MRSIFRKLLFTIPVYLLSISSLSAQNFSQEEHNGILYQVMENDIKPEASNALVIYLHGRSASGNDNQKQMEQPGVSAIAKYLKKNKMSSYFIVPQCPSDHEWDGRDGRPGYTDKVEELISFYLSSGDIDPERIYICGVSMGATDLHLPPKREPVIADAFLFQTHPPHAPQDLLQVRFAVRHDHVSLQQNFERKMTRAPPTRPTICP